MEIVHHLNDIHCPFVVSIGNFDGVHKGHRLLLGELVECSKRCQAKTCVVTFVPHPYEVVGSEEKEFLLNSYDERESLIGECGIDYLVPLEFTLDFSMKDPQAFLGEYIDSDFIRGIHVGDDFSFGSNKGGGYSFLKDYFKRKEISVTIQEPLHLDGERVSSTRIRELIDKGELSKAKKLLGRDFFISGIVKKGQGRGRDIGFPTANIDVNDGRIYPRRGVYLTRTRYKSNAYNSITNVGINPTFGDSQKTSVETNIFDFDQEIHGQVIKVEFIRRMRDEIKFSSAQGLVEQITQDIKAAREFFYD